MPARREWEGTCRSTPASRRCSRGIGVFAPILRRYGDPGDFECTDEESSRYDELCRGISREMLYMFSQVRSSTG